VKKLKEVYRLPETDVQTDEFTKLTRDYVATVTNTHLRHIKTENFRPHSLCTYFIGKYRFGPATRGNLYVPVAVIIDNDGVETASDKDNMYKSLSFKWQEALGQWLGSKNYDRLRTAIEKVMDSLLFWKKDYSDDMHRLVETMKDIGVKKNVYEQSVPIAVEDATLAPGVLTTIDILRNEIGVEPAQCSGTPQEVLEKFGQERLTIEPKLSEGTRFIWNRRGELVDAWSNVGFHKIYSKDALLRRLGCSSGLAIYPTDGAEKEDKPLLLNGGIDLGLILYVKREKGWFEKGVRRVLDMDPHTYSFAEDLKGFEGKIIIGSDAFAEDFTTILRPVELWMHARILTFLYDSPDAHLNVIDRARELKRLENECRSARGNDFYQKRNEAIDIAKSLRADKVVNLITYPYVSAEIDESLDELEALVKRNSTDIEKQKSLTTKIFNKFEQRLLEPNFSDTERDEVKKIRDVWLEKYGCRRWIKYGS